MSRIIGDAAMRAVRRPVPGLASRWARPLLPRTTLLSPLARRRPYSEPATPPTHDVAVLGGGITGLAAAYYLTRELPHAKVTIYEAQDRLGGWLDSKRVPVHDGTVLFEAATRSIRPQANGVLTASLVCPGTREWDGSARD